MSLMRDRQFSLHAVRRRCRPHQSSAKNAHATQRDGLGASALRSFCDRCWRKSIVAPRLWRHRQLAKSAGLLRIRCCSPAPVRSQPPAECAQLPGSCPGFVMRLSLPDETAGCGREVPVRIRSRAGDGTACRTDDLRARSTAVWAGWSVAPLHRPVPPSEPARAKLFAGRDHLQRAVLTPINRGKRWVPPETRAAGPTELPAGCRVYHRCIPARGRPAPVPEPPPVHAP